MQTFFHAQAAVVADQIGPRIRDVRKAAQTADELAALDEIALSVDLTGWAVLAGDVEPILEESTANGGLASLVQIGIGTESRLDIMNIVSADALEYAEARSAAMVGMRRDELGRLVPNPNAKWQILDTTRDGIRSTVKEAIGEGWSNDRLAAALRQSYGFSPERAMVIARTETNMASNAGALAGYRASGVVDGKRWVTAEDDLVTPECQENGAAGLDGDGVLLDLAADYPSGDAAPPAHPNCRCAIVPYIDWAKDEAAPQSQPTEVSA